MEYLVSFWGHFLGLISIHTILVQKRGESKVPVFCPVDRWLLEKRCRKDFTCLWCKVAGYDSIGRWNCGEKECQRLCLFFLLPQCNAYSHRWQPLETCVDLRVASASFLPLSSPPSPPSFCPFPSFPYLGKIISAGNRRDLPIKSINFCRRLVVILLR